MAIKPDLEEIRRIQEARRIRRERIEAQTERIEALIGGEVWTYGDKGLILTLDQVDALLALMDDQVTSAYERGTWAGQESATP